MDDLTPEIGDTVEWGKAEETEFVVSGQRGALLEKHSRPAPRGVIVEIYKNGVIKVQPEHQKRCMNFRVGEFTILSKAG
jgi:hypothetical protein